MNDLYQSKQVYTKSWFDKLGFRRDLSVALVFSTYETWIGLRREIQGGWTGTRKRWEFSVLPCVSVRVHYRTHSKVVKLVKEDAR